jgi:vancomycin permeability regulator SanA
MGAGRSGSDVRMARMTPGIRRLALCLVALIGCGTLLPTLWVDGRAAGSLRSVADVPHTGVALVFGAGLWDGEPSPYLAHRLDAAVALYAAGRVDVVLVSGDNSRTDYDEPAAMRTYLAQRGVPDRRIVSDFAGFDTWDSCVRARKIFGVHDAVLVSQGFHIRRAVALCRAAGVDGYGVGVDEPFDSVWISGLARENVAAGKALLDVVLRPDPHFLGPADPGVSRALAAPR